MRRRDRTFDPFSESPVDGVIAAHCSVQVGYQQADFVSAHSIFHVLLQGIGLISHLYLTSIGISSLWMSLLSWQCSDRSMSFVNFIPRTTLHTKNMRKQSS